MARAGSKNSPRPADRAAGGARHCDTPTRSRPHPDFGSSECGWVVEGQTGADYEAVEGFWPVLQTLESVADEGFESLQGDEGTSWIRL
ncbi:hypothetical protein GCM10010276_23520 [Streptomyces longisporus]|uniref:Uncharacterized protein n=1 Tax=Streptomyces longisporus TaxID=1948 RepID=A0ABP5YUX8_STRLO